MKGANNILAYVFTDIVQVDKALSAAYRGEKKKRVKTSLDFEKKKKKTQKNRVK